MPESQQDIDALLAEVNALADEAVATIAADDDLAPESPPPRPGVAARPQTESYQPGLQTDGPIRRSVKSGRIANSGDSRESENVSRILNIEVPIIVQLSARTMPLSDILNLTTGSIIEFEKPADGELELKVNNKIVGSGQAVKVGENFGLRVARIGTLRERIQALGAT
jgi:flagellar motor switch protein FliN